MKRELDDSIVVHHTMGGMIDFVEKGIYNNKLRISSMKYDKRWYVKLKDDNQKGSLRVNRKVVYNYEFKDDEFSIQEVENEVPVSEWIKIDMIVIMQD